MIKCFLSIALILSLVAGGDSGILRGHNRRNGRDRSHRDRANNGLGGREGSRHNQYRTDPSTAGLYCGSCDTRNCPLVSAETCGGQVIKDRCDCCPMCDTETPPTTPAAVSSNTTNGGCEKIKCPRTKICLLNIQDIPICRCPSTYYCRRQLITAGKRKEDELCGRDGKTYKNKCLLQVAECASTKKIRVAHKGRCLADGARKIRGHKKDHSKSSSVNDGGQGSRNKPDKTHNVNQYPANSASHKKTTTENAKNGHEGRRQKQKMKERRQRRKERINKRIKRRFGTYWL